MNGLNQMTQKELEIRHLVDESPEDLGLLNELASYLIGAEKYPEATVIFQKLSKLLPGSADALNNLAIAQLMSGQEKQAYKSIAHARKIDPENLQVQKTWIQLAILTNKDLEEALNLLNSLAAKLTTDPDILWMRSQCLLAMKKLDEVKIIYQQILTIQPDYELARLALNEMEKQ